ncbi:hypothetical protein EDB86DRAFT_3085251 [Lactarius hatsudake]|uniref:Ubiquinol-cytochrome-c reductase complex assembly factor 3 n=1 Tax=Lactarius akahatsu TaxID=416441 RepID=A0AAD4LSH2_9AGAM|nr:hypothetical protein EDB86DRAFT_3085251 [Lactarius hatsudake]KAH9001697.1 hypothetical protein EDB92DRAFT_1939532 [Lactarius akahatsu]KAH9028174.1 hypothetical protein EDB84DRAFT_1499064 [Lactarius hengduanensis]
MSGRIPWLQLTVVSAGIMGVGYTLLRVIVPSPEETYNAMAPDLKRKVDENRRARLALEEGIKQQQNAQLDPESAKPVWADQRKQ